MVDRLLVCLAFDPFFGKEDCQVMVRGSESGVELIRKAVKDCGEVRQI